MQAFACIARCFPERDMLLQEMTAAEKKKAKKKAREKAKKAGGDADDTAAAAAPAKKGGKKVTYCACLQAGNYLLIRAAVPISSVGILARTHTMPQSSF